MSESANTHDCDPVSVFLTPLSYTLSFHCPLVLDCVCLSVSQQCLLDRIKPAKHVRVYNIRKAQRRAFRGGNTHTRSHPPTTSSLPELHKTPHSSLKPQTHARTHILNTQPWTSSLCLPDWCCQHHLTGTWTCLTMPSHNTAPLRTGPWCLAPVAPSYQGRQSSVLVC